MWSDIQGQDKAIDFLKGISKTGRIAHAYLFAGPPAVGKYITAKAWAKAVNCADTQKNGEACGICRHCLKIDKAVHPDLLLIKPEGSKVIKIEQIRQLKKTVQYGPSEAKWKFVVIDPSEMMNLAAANSFLKLLEEPAPRVIIILIANNASTLLPTIRSRCQNINFEQLSPKVVRKILAEKFGFSAEQAAQAAQDAGGVLTDSILLKDPDVQVLLDKLEKGNFKSVQACLDTAKELLKYKEILASLLSIFLNRMFYQNKKKTCTLILATLAGLRYNVNKVLLIETFLLKMGELE